MSGARIIIVGGGAIGLAVAYQLARRGASDVLLLERHELTSGTSWHAAGIIGPLRASLALTRLAMRALAVLPALESDTGQGTGHVLTGGAWLAQSEARLRELADLAAIGDRVGLDAVLLTPEDVAARVPHMSSAGLLGGLWVAEDGQANPVDVCMAYARGARARGVRIEQGALVTALRRRGRHVQGVLLDDGRALDCELLVNCAGAWAGRLSATVDAPLPVQPVEHMYVVTEPVPALPLRCPVVRDLETGIYVKGDAGRLVLGGFEPAPKVLDAGDPSLGAPFLELPEDWAQFEPFMEAGLARFPVLSEVGIQRFMNGPESFTPDTLPLVGPVPGLDGCFVAAGFNSLGIVSSAGVGEAMAAWLLDGQPGMDILALDPRRFDRHAASSGYRRARMREAVADQLAMHWPGKQPRAARDVRRTPLHHAMRAAGAVFGQLAGWERPLWFARERSQRTIRYGHGPQHWWPASAHEASALTDGVGLIDLSPLTKLDVSGPDALALLERLCVSAMDIAPGRSIYTLMLNAAGTIESELMVLRIGEQHWRLVSGAASRGRDLDWLRRHGAGLDVQVEDRTATEAVLGVAGPGARELLQRLCDRDLGNDALPYGAHTRTGLALAEVRVLRLGYAGELGFEVHAPVEVAEHVYEQIALAGADHAMAHVGLYCLDGCRLEKGFVHFGHDVGPQDDPVEAALAWTVDWSKRDALVGGAALAAARDRPLTRTRMLLEVTDATPLLVHDQIVYRDGRPAGALTSACRGPRTGRALAMAWLDLSPGESRADLAGASFTIRSYGESFAARAHRGAIYDPHGRRMRS